MTTLHVTFRVGRADYAVAARDVLHLETFESATRVPGTPDYVAGLIQTRGRLLPVVDLRARFGLPPLAADDADAGLRRVVVVQHKARTAALLVDSAREVVQLDEATFEPPPELIDQQASGFVRAVATTAKRLLLLIDVPSVLGEELVR